MLLSSLYLSLWLPRHVRFARKMSRKSFGGSEMTDLTWHHVVDTLASISLWSDTARGYSCSEYTWYRRYIGPVMRRDGRNITRVHSRSSLRGTLQRDFRGCQSRGRTPSSVEMIEITCDFGISIIWLLLSTSNNLFSTYPAQAAISRDCNDD